MSHLTNDELIDAVEGTLRPARRHHIDTCQTCRVEIDRLTDVLRDVNRVEMPEPSPLFWTPFSARVHAAIAGEAAPRHLWIPDWLRGQVIAPIAALALLVLTLATMMPRATTAPAAVVVSGDPVAETMPDRELLEQEWALVADMVGALDVETAQQVGIGIGHGVAERAALELEAGEQQELMRLVREEIERAGG